MGWTSENVATDFDISRQAMDEYALLSHTRAAEASASGRFKEEIVPIETTVLVPKDGTNPKDMTDAVRKFVTVTVDEGLRSSTMEDLSKLKSAFPQWGEGKSTAGNSSPITDGAAAVMLMRRSKAKELGLEPLARHVTTAVTGVAPRHMGIAPSYAIP